MKVCILLQMGGVLEVYHQYFLSLVPGVGECWRVILTILLPGFVITE
jgi:hypothetical protein